MLGGQTRFARACIAAVAGVVLVLALVASSGSASSIADFTGHWKLNDHVVSGPETGEDYAWEEDWTQTGTELKGTGIYTISGSVSGSTATFKTTSASHGYVASFTLTMSADGKTLKGTADDNEGRHFEVTATGAGKPATEEPTKTTTSTETPKPPEPKPPSPKMPLLPRLDPRRVTGRIQSISGRNISVLRDGKRYSVTTESELEFGDVIETGTGTIAALEFTVGGRVGINRESKVTMTGERETVDGTPSGPRATIERGSLWVKPDSHGGKQPLEIQTNGGVMGIKG